MRRLLGLLLLAVLVACGQDDAGVGQGASAALGPQVQQLREAAAGGDRAGAERKLTELRQTVAGLRQRGELSDSGAARVLAAAAEVEAQLGLVPSTSTTLAPPAPGQSDTGGTRTTKRPSRGDDEDDD